MNDQPSPSQRLARLLARSADGDRAAFAELYEATSSKLYGVALRILRRSDLAEEAVQDAYVRVWRRASDFDPARASAIAWMSAIARNRSLDMLRMKKELPLEDAPEIADLAVDAPDPAAQAELADDLRRLSACLEELDRDRRDAVLLAYRSGWSREELAAHYDRPVATVKTWLRRSLMSLRRCLQS